MIDLHPSVRPVLEGLRERYPDTPFLALGQTVWWDEPMKAVLRRMLDSLGLGGRMVLGVHDTDYFAKLGRRRPGQSRFELMPHNDGTTKDLWSAAGEIARLFGSECFPTRHDFTRHRVPFRTLAAGAPEGEQRFLDEVTEAWGWRGLVYTDGRDLMVHNLRLRDVGTALAEMLRWGFQGTVESIVDDCCRARAAELAESLLGEVCEYVEAQPDEVMCSLYRHMYPRLFELLLGARPAATETSCTASLLRFAPETASLPRFALVDLFLNERTRDLAREAYDGAVAGTEMYTLDRFGLGALPFDLVIPEHGRGTLRVTLRAIHVETREPVRIPLREPIHSVQALAEVLRAELGPCVVLVGKAVALISMLAREFIFVFNEEGSAYVARTRQMNDFLRDRGIEADLRPILRLRYPTWDALRDARVRLVLPPAFAGPLGRPQLSGAELADSWRGAVDEQRALLRRLREITSPRELMAFLAGREGDPWGQRLAEYEEAKRLLRELRAQAVRVQQEVDRRRAELRETKRSIVKTERERGEHFRATTQWTSAQTERRDAYERRLAELLGARREAMAAIADLRAHRLELERGAQAGPARRRLAEIEAEAAMARLGLVRSAILTVEGLPHTQHRPAAWWIPMVDPSGAWFDGIVRRTEAYLEPVVSP
ncbi:MAG: hypothetical protein IT208_02430 [Chthonomonadales bacterium]|nr:hypothetical protein [Chthonomonadales bacterium]